MKKYKLIKEYPGSPKLGFIFTSTGNLMDDSNNFNLNNFKNYPEFWEEIVKKDYEILSFKYDNRIFSYTMINLNIKPTIHSVKRLSDGEIFTIGDKVQDSLTDNLTNYAIQEITYFHNGNKIICQAKSRTTMRLNTIRKAKQKLFITEDCVDIYEINKSWGVALKDGSESTISSDHIWKTFDLELWNEKSYNSEYWKVFSTKEKAEEYILMNKPLLSLNDVLEFKPTNLFYTKLLKRAQKLNNK